MTSVNYMTIEVAIPRRLNAKPDDAVPSSPRIPRVARLMALAIHFGKLLDEGVIADQAELARLGGVTRARITQILNLLHLAPTIQQTLLELTVPSVRDPIVLRDLQPIAAELDWGKQWAMWEGMAR